MVKPAVRSILGLGWLPVCLPLKGEVMKWTEDTALAQEILKAIAIDVDRSSYQSADSDRPSGIHLSELIYCLTKSWYKRKMPGFQPNERETLLFSTGIGLESVMLKPHRQQIALEVDGVNCTADFLADFGPPGEFKTTRRGTKRFIQDIVDGTVSEGWVRQILGYMHALTDLIKDDPSALKVREMMLAALFLMGNYSPPFPELKVWRMESTDEEVEANWQWVLYRKAIYEQFLDSDEAPPSFQYNMDWECDNCRLKVLCEARQYMAKQGKSI